MKAKNKKIKAVIFDIGGVLETTKRPIQNYRGNPHNLGVHEYVAKKLNISIDQYFDSIEIAYTRSIEGKLSKKEVVKILSLYFGVPIKKVEKLYKIAYKKNFTNNKKLFRKANKLRKLGYKIAILSDQWHLSKGFMVTKKLYKKFNPVILSCEVGLRKPNPKIYKLVLRKLNLKPEQTLFIDNQKWNITPAKKIGIKTILFKDNKQLFREPLWKKLWM